ncbi:MAG: hypothetical protein JST54_01830 [Deltaproteobacteria bacterium]|nr:hypothetical protein [Deltaproteobacteria bacterium]
MATVRVDGESVEVEIRRRFEPQKKSGNAPSEPGGFAFSSPLMLPIRPKECVVLEDGAVRPIVVRPLPASPRAAGRRPAFEYLATYEETESK